MMRVTTNPIESVSAEAPRVLVLLATFNGARWLDQQLDSILGQQGVQVTVLVADDGSSDGTVALVERRMSAQPTPPLLPAAGRRLGAAGNFLRLLREAPIDVHDFVALADQDDIWQLGRLARATEALDRDGAAGYSSDAMAFWADGRRRLLSKAFAQRHFDHLFEPAGPGCTYVLTATLVRALQLELRREPERFEGIGYHDWLIYAFARTHGMRWIIDAWPSVSYRQHDQNELGANFGLAGAGRRWGRLTSGWFRAQVLQIANLWPGVHGRLVVQLARLSLRDRLSLAWAARQCRRRPRDQLALAAMLLLYVLR
jgi:rhamnosyltransferase